MTVRLLCVFLLLSLSCWAQDGQIWRSRLGVRFGYPADWKQSDHPDGPVGPWKSCMLNLWYPVCTLLPLQGAARVELLVARVDEPLETFFGKKVNQYRNDPQITHLSTRSTSLGPLSGLEVDYDAATTLYSMAGGSSRQHPTHFSLIMARRGDAVFIFQCQSFTHPSSRDWSGTFRRMAASFRFDQ